MVFSPRRTRRVLIALCVAVGPIVACATGELGETDGVSEGDAADEVDARSNDASSTPDAPDDTSTTPDGAGDADETADASDASTPDGSGDAGETFDASDASSTADASNDASTAPDASDDAGTTPDASDDAGTTPDASDDAGSTPDASADAGPSIVFGTSCTAPTVYTEAFAVNPLNAGWQVLAGNVTYPAAGAFALSSGSPNTQVWIGARAAWSNYTISVPIRIDSVGVNGNGGVTFRMMSAGAANDSGQMYYAGITPTNVVLGVENGAWTQYAATAGTFSTGVFYTLTISASGNVLSVSATGGGGGIVTANHSTASEGPSTNFPTGSFGFRTFNMAMTYGPVTVTCN